MHSPKGQPSPAAASLNHPNDNNNNKGTISNSSSNSSLRSHIREKTSSLSSALHHLSHDSKHKNKDKDSKDISKMIGASLMTTSVLGTGAVSSPATRAALGPLGFSRERSGSASSQKSTKSSKSAIRSEQQLLAANHAALPPSLLPRSSLDNSSAHGPSHHHIRLPSFFKRTKHSSSLHSASSSSSSSTLQTPSHPHQRSLQQHTILMAPTHDIYLTWPYPVPSGNAFVAGTWSVPGHGPWDKLPMSRIPGTDTYEVHLDVQEVEDISNYLDDEGYLHHELLEHHHAHDHSFHENQASSASSTPSSTPSSRRRFLSRVFGRSRSSSTASNSAEAPKDLHPDLPYHHQSKDGVILPLTREYRYQFKFVIDDEWKCDPNRSQAPDDKGNWNHEIVVDLVEQVPQYPPSANRSRSSSLQSQHNDHATETEKLQDIPPVEEPPVTAATDDATPTLLSPPAPPVSNQSDSVSSTATTTANITTKGLESKDTIEAVMIFDESQDFSDGEGRSRRGNRDAQPPLESDDNDHDNNNNNNNSNNNINNENVGDDTAKEENVVAPQQVQDQQPHQEQTAPLAIDQEEHYPETPAAAIIVSSAAAELSIAGPDAREHEDISSSLAVSLPETEEHSFVEPTPQENAEIVVPLIEEEVATAVVDLDTVAITPEEPKAVEEPLLAVLEEPLVAVVEEPLVAVEEPLVAAVEEPLVVAVEEPLVVAIEEPLVAAVEEPLVATVVAATEEPAPKPVTPQRRMSYAAAVKTHPVVAEEPKPFVLQAAANPEEKRNKTARAALEVVTDAPAATTYSQVPSPPLTPSSYATDDESLKNELLEEEEQEDLPGPCELSVPLTPKSDMPSFKNLTLTEKTVEARDYSNGSADDNDDNDSETVDVLDDNTSIPSSSSSSSFLSSSALVSRSDETTKLPEQYPNIFWSMCKTTAVVSAAVVVIGLGLGRKKN